MWGSYRSCLKPSKLLQTHCGSHSNIYQTCLVSRIQNLVYGDCLCISVFTIANDKRYSGAVTWFPTNSKQPWPLRLMLASTLLLTDNTTDIQNVTSCFHWRINRPCLTVKYSCYYRKLSQFVDVLGHVGCWVMVGWAGLGLETKTPVKTDRSARILL